MTPNSPDDLHPEEPRLLTRREEQYPEPPPRAAPTLSPQRTLRGGRRVARYTGIVAAGVVFAVIAVLVFASLSVRHAMRASLPQLDGTLHVAGLTQAVTVTHDAQGVPSITASSLDDTLFAQGYVTAQDRLWQMDALRRHASGNLAEILGPGMIAHDRLQRTLQIRAAADRAIAHLPADQLHQLEVYARGVNAFMQQNADHLPAEFNLLHYTPAPWTPRDSLLVYLAMAQDLSTGFPTKLRREALAAHLPPQLLTDLYPVGSWRDHPPTQPPPDLTAPVGEVLQIPLDRSQSQLSTPADVLHLADELPEAHCTECRAGSNNWAVAGTRSASGQPLVSNDMHLNLSVPGIWYETSLHAPGLDVEGFALPGIPFIIVGRNQHVAWSITNLGGDVQDVRIEHTRGSGEHMEYQRPDNAWAPVGHHTETIVVRGGRNISLDVLTTTMRFAPATMSAQSSGVPEIETPIITPLLPSDHRVLSLAWTIYDPSTILDPFLAIDTAADGPSLVAAFSTFGVPSLNIVYADDRNHIGYHAIGAIPVRGAANQQARALAPIVPFSPSIAEDDEQQESDENSPPPPDVALPTPAETLTYTIGSPISPVPVDALNSAQIWSGYVPYAALPAIVDPADGVLATANSRITPNNYPYDLTLNWAPPYRAERIYKLLSNRTHLTPADMLATELDVYSAFDLVLAQRVAYAVDHASPTVFAHDTKQLRQAANILRDWQGNVTTDAAAPSIVTAVRDEILPMLLLPQIVAHDKAAKIKSKPLEVAQLYTWGGETVAIENLLEFTPARWRPAGFKNWNDLLASVLLHALEDAHAPADLTTWQYDKTHTLALTHPVFGMTPLLDRMLDVRTGTGPQPIPGDGTTIRALGGHTGPSERFTADLADPQATLANITTGESGNPLSPYYLDQFHAWLTGTTFTLPLKPIQTTHTLTLVP